LIYEMNVHCQRTHGEVNREHSRVIR